MSLSSWAPSLHISLSQADILESTSTAKVSLEMKHRWITVECSLCAVSSSLPDHLCHAFPHFAASELTFRTILWRKSANQGSGDWSVIFFLSHLSQFILQSVLELQCGKDRISLELGEQAYPINAARSRVTALSHSGFSHITSHWCAFPDPVGV